MRDGSFIDATFDSELLLGQSSGFTQCRDPRVDGAAQTTPSRLTFHPATVDHRSTEVKRKRTTVLPEAVKRSKPMGDERHKRSPLPADLEEDVTDAFRQEVRDVLEINEISNKRKGLKKGTPGYLISNQSELADALTEELGHKVDKNSIKKLIGGVRPETKVKLTERSTYVGAIRRVLQLAPVMQFTVRADRAPLLRLIAGLPEEEFKIFERAVADRVKR
jgi:hypothetical protein